MNLNNFLEFKSAFQINSQLGQDALVLWLLNQKTNGYFIEFGAADGVNISNTFLLEKDYGWSGILCEPARVYKDRLSANRKCTIVDKCVYSKSGDVISFFAPNCISRQEYRIAFKDASAEIESTATIVTLSSFISSYHSLNFFLLLFLGY